MRSRTLCEGGRINISCLGSPSSAHLDGDSRQEDILEIIELQRTCTVLKQPDVLEDLFHPPLDKILVQNGPALLYAGRLNPGRVVCGPFELED